MQPFSEIMSYQKTPPSIKQDGTAAVPLGMTITPSMMTTTGPRSKRMLAIVAVAGMLMLMMAGGAVLLQDGGSSYHSLSESGSLTSTAARIFGSPSESVDVDDYRSLSESVDVDDYRSPSESVDVDDYRSPSESVDEDGPTEDPGPTLGGTHCPGRDRHLGCFCGISATGTLWACDHLLYCDDSGICSPEEGKRCGWTSWCEGGNSFRCCEGKCINQRVCHHAHDDDYV